MYYGNVSFDFSLSTIKWASDKIKVNELTKQRYQMEEDAGLVSGLSKEFRVKRLVQMLDGVKEVYVAASGSIMDVTLKSDIAIEFEDGRCGIFQVKSSQAGAKSHMANSYIEYNKKQYELPGVYWFEDGLSNIAALKELSRWLEAKPNPQLIKDFNICTEFANKGVSSLEVDTVRNMFPKTYEWLKFLGKLHITSNLKVKFM